VLAACLVSGLATGVKDAAAQIDAVCADGDMEFGRAAGDADLAGTVVVDPNENKTVTGGVFDFGGGSKEAIFVIITQNDGDPYSCTLPGSITVTSGGSSATVNTFTTNLPLSGNMPGGDNELEMFVGATFQVAAGQAAGDYTGNLTLTCDGFSGTVEVRGTVFEPISISVGADMDFGTMITTGTAGTVTVTPAGARSSVNVDLLGGFPAAAVFDVTGEGGNTYSITLSSSTTLSSGGDTMTVDTFTHDAGGNPQLSGGGSDTFNVGATLHVGATQAPGTYSGTFSATANYN